MNKIGLFAFLYSYNLVAYIVASKLSLIPFDNKTDQSDLTLIMMNL